MFRVFRVLGLGWGLEEEVEDGVYFGFGRTKPTRNVIWGSILTPSGKCSKQL